MRTRKEVALAGLGRALLLPLFVVIRAEMQAGATWPLTTWHLAAPGVDRMVARDVDDLAAEQGVEVRGVDQRSKDLQPIAGGPGCAGGLNDLQVQCGHRCPHALHSASASVGSWMSACP